MFWEIIQDFLEWAVGLREDAANAAGSLHAKVAKLQNDLNTLSVVKSVQRGVSTVPSKNDRDYYTFNVTITAVNMAKTFVTAQNANVQTVREGYGDYQYHSSNVGVRATLTSPTNLEIYVRGISNVDGSIVSWQVVEFN